MEYAKSPDYLDKLIAFTHFDDYCIYFASIHSSDYSLKTKVLVFIRPSASITRSEIKFLTKNLVKPTRQINFSQTILNSMRYFQFKNDYNSFGLLRQTPVECK